MRHFLIALMIALLPVRGWVGEAMAFSMPGGPAATASHAGCPDHAAPAQAADSQEALVPLAGASTTDDGAHQHSLCDVCNGPALAASLPGLGTQPLTHIQHTARLESFASSEPRQGVKPPIS